MAKLQFFVILAIYFSVVFAHQKHTFAWTNQGLVRGLIRENSQVFLGLPFAAPPKRFQAPVPPSFRWSLFDATKNGNACPQPGFPGQDPILTEDCLNLNIFAPKNACPWLTKLPVLVYWDGGSFIFGSNSRPLNQAEQLAKEGNMIVVVANHRLGPLGFLYVNEMREADGYKDGKVNFAMLDMIRALKWVKHNIAHFGGDPSQVTIGGLSSGAFMASWLTTVPQAFGLFKNVIQIEGPLTAVVQAVVQSPETADYFGQNLAASVGCAGGDANTVMNCLANADLLTLVNNAQSLGLLPVVDGDVFPINPDVAITNPTPDHVKPAPSLMLTLPNPGSYFVGPYVELAKYVGWANLIGGLFGEAAPAILQQYSDAIYGNESDATIFARGSVLITDAVWSCTLRRHANLMTQAGATVYALTWNTRASFISAPPEFGIIHGTPVPFLFGNAVDILTQQKGQFTPTEAKISKDLIAQVANFVRKGKLSDDYLPWSSDETNTLINPDGVPTTAANLGQIRAPPSGLGYPTRCELFDAIFAASLGLPAQKESEFLERFWANGGNFWDSRMKNPPKITNDQ